MLLPKTGVLSTVLTYVEKLRCMYHSQSAKLPLIVAEVDGKPAIIARNWPSVVKVNWSKDLFNVSSLDLVN